MQVALTTVAKVPPATQFEYTDANPVLVGAAISTAAGEPEDKLAEERLFKPLGMKNYHWTGADQTGSVSGGWGLRLRAVDMAKLGVMMLHGGQWQGRQVVPQSWIEQMSTPSATAKDYGYYCWINHIVETEPEFGAMGFKGQFITVLPKENAVVVMTSILPTDGGLQGRHLPEPLPAHGERLRAARHARHGRRRVGRGAPSRPCARSSSSAPGARACRVPRWRSMTARKRSSGAYARPPVRELVRPQGTSP